MFTSADYQSLFTRKEYDNETTQHLNSFCCAIVAIAIFAGPPAMATEKKQQKPNVVFILADNVGYGDMVRMVVESFVERRRRTLIDSPAMVYALHNFWSSLLAHHRGRR